MNEKFPRAVVLVIDDEMGPRESLRFLLKDQYEVICASSVDEGVAQLRSSPPDVVLMDIKMPGKSGIDGLREIREMDSDVAIIMLTGFGSLETAQEAIRHGASDYVKKPFDAVEMRQMVQAHVNQTRLRRGREAAYEHLRNLNAQLQSELSQKEHMAQLGQASTEFVHDIRSPLMVICGYVNLLMDNIKNGPSPESKPQDAERTREYLEQMERSVLRCQEMSQMWRDLTVNGGANMRFSLCSLTEILEEVRDVMQPLADKIHAQFDLRLPNEALPLNGDNLQLYRAFQNLVGNAFQAVSPQGGGRVIVSLCRHGDGQALVEILDNGCGIPPDKLDTVFQPYTSSKQASGGMGIGLYITRKVIEMHKGQIELANRPEGGVRVGVILPLAETT